MSKEADIKIYGLESPDDLKREYPSLQKIEEFKDLSPKQVRFCWLVGNRTSPIIKLDKAERIKKALFIVHGSNYELRKECQDILNDEIPDEILDGIRKMISFNPEYRLKGKLMAEYIFDTLMDIIVLNDDTKLLMDTDEKNKYTTLAVKISSELPGMIDKIESAYGARIIDKKTKKEVVVNINTIT